jgi:hypothetical protein
MLSIEYYYYCLYTEGNQPDENERMEGFMLFIWNIFFTNKTNSMVWVRERTIPTKRPPLVGEVIANFCG